MLKEEIFVLDCALLLPELYYIGSFSLLLSLGIYYSISILSVEKLLSLQLSQLSCLLLFYFTVLIFKYYPLTYVLMLGSFEVKSLSYFFIFLVNLSLSLLFLLSTKYVKQTNLTIFELPLLLLLIVCGNMIIILSNDFLVLYLGIELQGLGLYILASLRQNSTYSTEAGLKYFILGAFASSMLLFGISFFYGFTGTINFDDAFILFYSPELLDLSFSSGIIWSFLFIFLGLLFKLGAAPFHTWVPDVYEGSPLLITAFFALIPKIAILSIFIKLIFFTLSFYESYSFFFLSFSALSSILIGSLGALKQIKLKRLLSYSAIGHSGFFLVGLSSANIDGLLAVIIYLLIYLLLLLNIFGVLLNSIPRHSKAPLQYIKNIRYIFQENNLLGLVLVFAFFSIAGIPPLSGFFSKVLILLSGLEKNLYLLIIFCLASSIMGVAYYLRLIRGLLFIKHKAFYIFFYDYSTSFCYILSYLFIFNCFFFLYSETFLYIVMNLALRSYSY